MTRYHIDCSRQPLHLPILYTHAFTRAVINAMVMALSIPLRYEPYALTFGCLYI